MADWTAETPPEERSEDGYIAYTHADDHRRISRILLDAKTWLISRAIFRAKGDLLAGTGPDAAARVPVGADGTLLIADSAADAGVTWVPFGSVPGAGGAPLGADPASGRWKGTDNYRTASSIGATPWPSGHTATFVPLLIEKTTTLDRVGVITAGSGNAAGRFVRLGIFASNGTSSAPFSLVVDGGQVELAANATVYTVTVSATLAPGLYWCVVVKSTTASTIMCTTDYGSAYVLYSGAAVITTQRACYTANLGTSGTALPATLTGVPLTAQVVGMAVPLVSVRVV